MGACLYVHAWAVVHVLVCIRIKCTCVRWKSCARKKMNLYKHVQWMCEECACRGTLFQLIIISTFRPICNSTELDSHTQYKHIKYKAIQMRRYMTRNVMHTKSIFFVSDTILTLNTFVVLTEFYCQWYIPTVLVSCGIYSYGFRVMGTYWIFEHHRPGPTVLVVPLTRKEVIKPVCGFHSFLEIFFAQAISSFLQTL